MFVDIYIRDKCKTLEKDFGERYDISYRNNGSGYTYLLTSLDIPEKVFTITPPKGMSKSDVFILVDEWFENYYIKRKLEILQGKVDDGI
jgi:hypothetical protein